MVRIFIVSIVFSPFPAISAGELNYSLAGVIGERTIFGLKSFRRTCSEALWGPVLVASLSRQLFQFPVLTLEVFPIAQVLQHLSLANFGVLIVGKQRTLDHASAPFFCWRGGLFKIPLGLTRIALVLAQAYRKRLPVCNRPASLVDAQLTAQALNTLIFADPLQMEERRSSQSSCLLWPRCSPPLPSC